MGNTPNKTDLVQRYTESARFSHPLFGDIVVLACPEQRSESVFQKPLPDSRHPRCLHHPNLVSYYANSHELSLIGGAHYGFWEYVGTRTLADELQDISSEAYIW